jgi:hypothetical protein
MDFENIRNSINIKKYEIITSDEFNLEAFQSFENMVKSLNQIVNNQVNPFIFGISSYLEVCYALKTQYIIITCQLKESLDSINVNESDESYDSYDLIRYTTINLNLKYINNIIGILNTAIASFWKDSLVNINNLFELLFKDTTNITDDFKNLLEFLIKLNLPLKEIDCFIKFVPYLLSCKLNCYVNCKLYTHLIENEMKVNMDDFITNIHKLYKLYNQSKNESYIDMIFTSLEHFSKLIRIGYYTLQNKDNVLLIINILIDLFNTFFETKSSLISINDKIKVYSKFTIYILEIFQEFSFLINTYLIRDISVIFLNILNFQSFELNFIFKQLFELLHKNIYFEIYISTIIDENGINNLKHIVKKNIIESITKKMHLFKKLCEKDKESEFIDNISSTFIINPSIIKNGDNKIYCDKFVMLSYLHKTPENPYNRESLTPADFEKYNEELKDEILMYDKKRREFINFNK